MVTYHQSWFYNVLYGSMVIDGDWLIHYDYIMIQLCTDYVHLDLLSSDSFSSLTLPTSAFPSVHVGSLTSKLPSMYWYLGSASQWPSTWRSMACVPRWDPAWTLCGNGETITLWLITNICYKYRVYMYIYIYDIHIYIYIHTYNIYI